MGHTAGPQAHIALIVGLGVVGVGLLTALVFALLGWLGLPMPSGWFGFAIGVLLSLGNGWRATRAWAKGGKV